MFNAAGGAAGLRHLAEAWHVRVMADEVVAHAFSHGFRPDHTERLASYWAEALGGPASYTQRYGDESFVLALVRRKAGEGWRRGIEAQRWDFDAAEAQRDKFWLDMGALEAQDHDTIDRGAPQTVKGCHAMTEEPSFSGKSVSK